MSYGTIDPHLQGNVIGAVRLEVKAVDGNLRAKRLVLLSLGV